MKANTHGFTFIELLIAIGIISLTLPILFNLFLINLKAQSRIIALQEVKKNGDYALLLMQSSIRQNAKSIHSASPATVANEECSEALSTYPPVNEPLYFRDNSGNTFSYLIQADQSVNKITFQSVSSTSYLTNRRVTINNWSISCKRPSTFAHPIVFISFSVTSVAGASQPSPVTLNFQTAVALRN